jgi:hypothetical protein
MQKGIDPLTALALAYANYPSRDQPHELKANLRPPAAWGDTEDYLDEGIINLDELCHHLFGMSPEQVHDAMLHDEKLKRESAAFSDLLMR